MVFDLWNTKTLMYQVTSTRKRKKVGTDLYIYEEEETVRNPPRSYEKYLANMHTYLLALAIAGSHKAPGADAACAEQFGADSTIYVTAP